MKRWKRVSAAIVAALAILGSGCSGTYDGGGDTGTGQQDGTTGDTGNTGDTNGDDGY